MSVMDNSIQLAGPGWVVQIDESLFNHKQKYHHGRVADHQIWMFDICCTSTSPARRFNQVVGRRNAYTLLPIRMFCQGLRWLVMSGGPTTTSARFRVCVMKLLTTAWISSIRFLVPTLRTSKSIGTASRSSWSRWEERTETCYWVISTSLCGGNDTERTLRLVAVMPS